MIENSNVRPVIAAINLDADVIPERSLPLGLTVAKA
jgi:hypothetical protein